MVRIKLPAGTITPEQLDLMGHLAETYSRGWGHITTRQNVQIHYVELTRVPERHAPPRRGRTDHPRGLRRHRAQRDGLPPRRRLPARAPRRHAVGRSHVPAFRAQPARPAAAAQVQDQLLRLRHRLRPGDVQRRRRHRHDPHRSTTVPPRPASAVYIAGGLGRQPAPGPGARGVHRRAKTCCRPSRRCCGCSTRPATATTSCGPA